MRLLLALVLLLAPPLVGRATAQIQNTPAQDLAWERWYACNRFASVRLNRIELDGRIWVNYRVTGEYRLWVECIQEAAKKQAGRTKRVVTQDVVGSGPTDVSTDPSSLFPAAAPVWKEGSEWAFRSESPRERDMFVWTVSGEDTYEDVPVYVVRSQRRRLMYRRGDLAFYVQALADAVEIRYAPPRMDYVWPLAPGRTWDQEITYEQPTARGTAVVASTCETAPQPETVTVPAGSFITLRISCRNTHTGEMIREIWYAPTVAHWVKQRAYLSDGVRERELLRYRLR